MYAVVSNSQKKGKMDMKVVILAGGFGTRISEESHLIPKPMIQIGDMPILWHIMKQYSHYGFNEFVICGGYKQHVIKEFFADYYLHRSDITFDFSSNGEMTVHTNFSEPWKVTIVDTGLNTMTGGRVKRVKDYIGDEPFFLTYGDGVSDVDINKLLEFHKAHGRMATLTAIKITARFGVLDINEEGCIQQFRAVSSTVALWCFSPKFLTLSKAIQLYLKSILLKRLQDVANLWHIPMTASGSVWIH